METEINNKDAGDKGAGIRDGGAGNKGAGKKSGDGGTGGSGGAAAKRLLAAVAALAAIAGGVFFFAAKYTSAAKESPPVLAYTVLAKGELYDGLEVRGIVESAEKHNIYASLGFPVKHISAETGDRVAEGQILAVLDTENLELDIAARKAELALSQENARKMYENSETAYSASAGNLERGTNSQVRAAQSALNSAGVALGIAQHNYDEALAEREANDEPQVRVAKTNLDTAQKNYNDALSDFNDGTDARVASAESALAAAELDLDSKEETYENVSGLYKAGGASKDELRRAEEALAAARNRYGDAAAALENARLAQRRSLEQAQRALAAARTGYDNAVEAQEHALEQAENALNSARAAYENAAEALNTAQVNARQDVERQKGNVESAQISLNSEVQQIVIQKLEKQLRDASIASPAAGTVTAVYAKKGAPGSGLLFVVEDADSLKVKIRINEYDVERVRPGMAAEIKSDAVSGATYKGVVSKIDPAAVKNAQGDTDLTASIDFIAEIAVTGPSSLRIGMDAFVTIKTELRNGAYIVPCDAVALGAGGARSVFVAAETADGQYTATRMDVGIGMETDDYAELKGGWLRDGLIILNDASLAADGMPLLLK